jgi:hypothetical protein
MKLENLNLVELSTQEKKSVDGGGLPPWVRNLGPWGAAAWAISNWSDIKSGLSDGWNKI